MHPSLSPFGQMAELVRVPPLVPPPPPPRDFFQRKILVLLTINLKVNHMTILCTPKILSKTA